MNTESIIMLSLAGVGSLLCIMSGIIFGYIICLVRVAMDKKFEWKRIEWFERTFKFKRSEQ